VGVEKTGTYRRLMRFNRRALVVSRGEKETFFRVVGAR
jgi:hypothetical protein